MGFGCRARLWRIAAKTASIDGISCYPTNSTPTEVGIRKKCTLSVLTVCIQSAHFSADSGFSRLRLQHPDDVGLAVEDIRDGANAGDHHFVDSEDAAAGEGLGQ